MTPMPVSVIEQINLLVKYQQELLIFASIKLQLIGDGNVDLIGVDGDENEAPLKIVN